MKKTLLFLSILLLFPFYYLFSQENNLTGGQSSIIVTTHSAEEAQFFFNNYSVEKIWHSDNSENLNIQICLAAEEYDRFYALSIPYQVVNQPNTRALTMATTVAQMANWNRYPTLSVYLEMMQNFQSNYPNLCDIDTILAQTPEGRPILVAHLSNNVHTDSGKPQFWYASAMHGDELTSIVLMLRLIDYLLTNYGTNDEATYILNNIDLWISPMDNPDGTFYQSSNSNSVSNSRRANANGIDLNRSFLLVPNGGYNNGSNVAEVLAMQTFAANHHFTMSANFHGGTELVNYPWDYLSTSDGGRHADNNWWIYVAGNYADSCQSQNSNYFSTEFSSGITQGGDWYVTTGCRQDYMNYYRHCKESTIEISIDKQLDVNQLNTHWNYNKASLLNYIKECNLGFGGIVYDVTDTTVKLEANIFIDNHDERNTNVFSHLPMGNYHRPVEAGTHFVTVSADCYIPQSFYITTSYNHLVRKDVALIPITPIPNVPETETYTGNSATLINTNVNDFCTTNWYESVSATTPVFVGNIFTTPNLNSTTTYYVETQGTGIYTSCVSERIPITVTVLSDNRPFIMASEIQPSIFNFGEETDFSLSLLNVGALATTSNCNVTISCTNPDITIIDNNEAYPPMIAINGSAVINNGFRLYVRDNLQESKDVLLQISISYNNYSWTYYQYIHLIGIDCDAPAGLTISASGTQLDLSWDEVDGANYYKVFREDLLIADSVPDNHYTDFDLLAGEEHCYKIRTICENGASVASEFICATVTGEEFVVPGSGTNSVTTCGATIYDHAGADGNYSNNRNGKLTISSSDGLSRLSINGSYNTEADYDILYIYDGSTTNGTLLGEFSGSGTISDLESNSNSITLKFTSDQYLNEAGFSLNVSCITDCDTALTLLFDTIESGTIYDLHGFFETEAGTYSQHLHTTDYCDSLVILNLFVNTNIENFAIDEEVLLYPNPATSSTLVYAPFPITKISLYDNSGKIIFIQENVNLFKTTVDVGEYASGFYFINIETEKGNCVKKLIINKL